ncbi:beta-glucosidase [Rhizomicrobium palustre]|uniref:Beta-glucosidase n=1 Tax=Rhizomicrobium palustre TaxID=189966 RepID=A0A846N052_9PROT|nr:glycoside hydrolase family 3 C-terminal domain-containing protein [Rhizomicrobium palustre]NIK88879.1 beta-glucosidase [Rhizomicrobium palustre]
MRVRAAVAVSSVLLFSLSAKGEEAPYKNPDLSPQVRAADLVSRMTLDEKVLQMQSTSPAIPRLGVPGYNWWGEALHGVANGHATVFPQAIGLGATFDPDLIHRVADVISTEARAKFHEAIRNGVPPRQGILPTDIALTFWSPNINIFRDPRWGRGQETYGEDPYLSGRLGVAFVKGMQGDDPRYLKTVATPKHYAVHSGPETQRHTFDARVSDYDLNNTYLPAFRAAVTEGKAESVMCVYNSVAGVPGCASADLLQKTLRQDWGFNGYVVSDCGAVDDIFRTHKYTKTMGEAAVAAVKAGTDLSCGTEYETLPAEVKAGRISEADINRALERDFVARFRLGMFDPVERVPYASIPITENDSAAHRKLALEAENKAIVLLKNDKNVLPLAANVKTIAVLGPSADDPSGLLGNYNGISTKQVTPLEGITKQFTKAQVRYSVGAAYTDSTPVPVTSAALSQADGKGAGVKVEYFDNAELKGTPKLTRIESRIHFSDRSADAESKAVIAGNKYSIRWSGTFTPPVSGEYLLAARTHMWNRGGKIHMFIDGKDVGSNSVQGPGAIPGAQPMGRMASRNADAKLSFEAGRAHSIRVELSQDGPEGTTDLNWVPPKAAALAEAAKVVKASDVAVVFVGLNSGLEGEQNPNVNIPGFFGGDRTSIDLPEPQEKLVQTAIATGKPVIVVMTSGSALAVNYAAEHAAAVISAWYGGEETGTAVAQTLAGVNNPAGRLPVTFYKSTDQLPPFTDYAMKGRTYRYFSGEPLYGFGYGLSYAKFEYSGLKTERSASSATVTATVKNSSNRDGDEVVQLYVSGTGQEIRSLKGFERVHLKAGESRVVSFPLKDVPASKITVSVGGGQPVKGVAFVQGSL